MKLEALDTALEGLTKSREADVPIHLLAKRQSVRTIGNP